MARSKIAIRIAGILAMAVLVIGSLGQSGTQVSAAPLSAPVNQCNNVAASNVGGQGMSCTVTVVNNLTSSGAAAAPSTITTTVCVGAAGPIGAGAGTCATTTSTSATPVNQVTQCDGISNEGGGVMICSVTITNNFAGTLSQAPVPASVYQCFGSVITGTGAPGTCTPVNTPGVTSVTAATVGQCNGSGNGGTSVGFTCTVTTNSTTTSIFPVNVDQCNGSANGGGALTRCQATVNSVVTAAAAPTASPTPVVAPTAAPVTGLPSTSTIDSSGPAALFGLLLAFLGALLIRSRRTVPADR